LPLGAIIPYTRTDEQEQLFASNNLTGFCPCHAHAVLLLKGDCTPESLIQPYRKAPNPFSTKEMTRGLKKLIAQNNRTTEPQNHRTTEPQTLLTQ
jgi:saccharopine dehydrogenase-like NADP-dependent oxidoreductase